MKYRDLLAGDALRPCVNYVDRGLKEQMFKILTHARIDSVTVPIWLTLSSRQLQAFSSTALLMRLGLVTVRSSPTIWMSVLSVKLVQAAQSSWSKGSSMETTVSEKHAAMLQQLLGQDTVVMSGCLKWTIALHCTVVLVPTLILFVCPALLTVVRKREY